MLRYILSILLTSIWVCSFAQSNITLVQPKPNAIISTSSIEFVWNEVQGAMYDFEIYLSQDLNNPIVSIQSANNSEIIGGLATNQSYSWRVGIDGVYSTFLVFTIFNPLDITDCVLWVNADSGVVLNAGSVQTWQDFSASNNQFTQSSAGNRPTTGFFPQIGHDALIFDGVDDFMTLQNPMLIGSTFVLSNWNDASPTFPNFNGLLSSQVTGQFLFVANQGTTNLFGPTGANYYSNNVRINGVSTLNVSPLNAFKIFEGTANTVQSIAELLVCSDRLLGGRYWRAAIPEIIVYSRNISTTERELIYGYLRYKYAPPVNLGANISMYAFCDTTLHAGERFTSFLWSTGETTENIAVTESGTYWVNVVDIFGFTSSDTIVVNYPEIEVPAFNFYCPGSSITWNTNLGPHYTYEWSTGETTESIEIDSPGSYFVTVTDTNGCIRVFDPLFIDEDPFATTVSLGPDANLCVGNAVQLTSGATDAVSYLWHTGETTPSIEATVSGTYSVEVENANGCVAEDEVEITILGTAPTMGSNLVVNYCQGEDIAFEDASFTTDGSEIISWSWDFGDGSVYNTSIGNHIYTSSGNFLVELEVESNSGCSNTALFNIVVAPKPSINFSTTGTCQGSPIGFFSGQTTPQQIANWLWNFGDPASGGNNTSSNPNPTHIFSDFGSFQVELIGEDVNGCRDTSLLTLNILPSPQVNFSFQEVCAGGVVQFQNNTTVPSPATILNQSWTFGDGTGSAQVNPSKPYPNHGNYNVTLTVNANNGCSAQLMQPVKVHAIPQPNYTTNATCAGVASNFSDASFVPNGSVAIVSWSFNGSSPIQGLNVNYNFPSTGSNQVLQTVTSGFGCVGASTTNVSLNSFLSADFEIQPAALLAEYPMVFNNLSVGQTSNSWIINGGAPLNVLNPEVTFSANDIGQQVEVTLLVSNSDCIDSITKTYTILENRTDLAVNQVFVQNVNGFYIVGAELENRGSTPITRADVFLRSPNASLIKETWTGLLEAGEKENYIFNAQISASINKEKETENFICVEGQIVLPAQFLDQDLTNNSACKALLSSGAILLTPYPNPIGDHFTLQIVLPTDEVVTVEIVDGLGRIIQTLLDESQLTEGLNNFTVDASAWSSGIYSIVLRSSEGTITKKVLKAQ